MSELNNFEKAVKAKSQQEWRDDKPTKGIFKEDLEGNKEITGAIIKGDLYKPTKECKHVYNLDFGVRCLKCDEPHPACGVTEYMTGELPIKEIKIDTILKEADKLFDEKFIKYGFSTDNWDKVKDFIHSQIEIAYTAGNYNGELEKNGWLEYKKDELKQQTIKQIEEWAEEYDEHDEYSDVIDKEDLKRFINNIQ